eukprot:TRINITY_DN45504_c0_g1_i1.p1 TRINITY_DN45504_c0_g1~~TRINITY_DN45504_c0_g1_i1.p1  ORF type:complete len:258 (-),score=27.41 TRINITY_DN45504_c0_g1_i1:331-1074(-)
MDDRVSNERLAKEQVGAELCTLGRKPLVVGVAGPSGSGKSTLASSLAKELRGVYIPESAEHFVMPYAPYSVRDDRHEAPSNVKWDAAREALAKAIEAASSSGVEVVVVEHYLLLAEESSLLELVDRFLYLDPVPSSAGNGTAVSKDLECLQNARRRALDLCMERRVGRGQRAADEADHLRRYYEHVVWPRFLQHTDSRIAEVCIPEHLERLSLFSSAAENLDLARQACRHWLSGRCAGLHEHLMTNA